jgi:transposase
VPRQHGIAPSQLFRCRKLSNPGALQAEEADKSVVPVFRLQGIAAQVRSLQGLLAEKSLQDEILKEAMEAVEKNEQGLCSS